MRRTAIVIPCYNEARRLAPDAFVRFCAAERHVELVLVDDGSRDETLAVLSALAGKLDRRASVIAVPSNEGKAAAVRRGMLCALDSGADYAGYWDADLATPLDAIPELAAVLDRSPDVQTVFGSRVQLLGRAVTRRPSRHYVGRIFATMASQMLGLPIYDTQCGAKLFRNTGLVRELFEAPFATRWIFDVELLARLVRAHREGRAPSPASVVSELPLREWRDVMGSKVRPADVPRVMGELVTVYRRYLRPGAAVAPDGSRAGAPRVPEPGSSAGHPS